VALPRNAEDRQVTAVFELALDPGPAVVVLRHPASQAEVGHWHFSSGGRLLTVDFLGDATSMCRVDGRNADEVMLEPGFIAWPRMTFVVNGREVELVSRDADVLRNHYSRPHHQEEAYTPGPPDPFVEVFHRARIAQVRRLLRGVHGRVLDAGSGYSLVVMAGPWPDFEVVACDRDPGAVRLMTEQRRAQAVIGSAEELPFEPGIFDAVFAGEIVEHLADPDQALRGWIKALRPGGRLVLTTPNRTHLMARLTGRYQPKNPEHLFEYTSAELLSAVRRAGGRIEHLEGLQMPLPVWIPRMGWRDALWGVRRRWGLPLAVYDVSVRAGRRFPSLAENLAVVAIRP
jgi:SAM-dependent methyltransferase